MKSKYWSHGISILAIIGVLLISGCVQGPGGEEPEISLNITEVPIVYAEGYYNIQRIDFAYENVGNAELSDPAFDFLLLRDGETVVKDINVELLAGPIMPGNKGSLSGGITGGRVKETGRYTLVIKVHQKGEAKIVGSDRRELLITKEKYGCRKGTCVDVPDEWYILQECIVEKCSCIECDTYPECWSAWTGMNCSVHEDCRDIYGTNYREATFGYVYRIDPTKKTEGECSG